LHSKARALLHAFNKCYSIYWMHHILRGILRKARALLSFVHISPGIIFRFKAISLSKEPICDHGKPFARFRTPLGVLNRVLERDVTSEATWSTPFEKRSKWEPWMALTCEAFYELNRATQSKHTRNKCSGHNLAANKGKPGQKLKLFPRILIIFHIKAIYWTLSSNLIISSSYLIRSNANSITKHLLAAFNAISLAHHITAIIMLT
jgi:hypothetical protein